jgi:hypothetical protein
MFVRVPERKGKRLVYIVATIVTVAIFVPFQAHRWSIYAGACAGYTVLVFGLRRIELASVTAVARPIAVLARTHLSFLAIVITWVWLCVRIRTRLPYIFTTEDSSHPYFGLAFLGILGLLLLENFEQKFLQPTPEPGTHTSQSELSQVDPK